jgi:hypothetical protein
LKKVFRDTLLRYPIDPPVRELLNLEGLFEPNSISKSSFLKKFVRLMDFLWFRKTESTIQIDGFLVVSKKLRVPFRLMGSLRFQKIINLLRTKHVSHYFDQWLLGTDSARHFSGEPSVKIVD